MRIVQIVPSLDVGGMERLTVDLARCQKRVGHDPAIYCTCHPGQLAGEAESAGIPVRAFGKPPGISAGLVWNLARRLRQDRVDVLHAHNALVLHYAVAAARLAGVPVVANTRHGGNMNWDPHCERIWRQSTRWADAVIFISEGVRDFYVKRSRISHREVRVIYNGIDVDKFSQRRATPGASRPRFRFGTVGRLVPAKDHVSLVKAFAMVASTAPEAELHILGDGPCRAEIAETAAALPMADRIVLHGRGYDVAGFLSSLDAFVLSSVDEGLPIAVMEAMAAGLPIVSTRLPGLTELAPDHAVAGYCPPGKPELLAELMSATMRRTDLASVGETALGWAQRFGIAETWRRYESTFEELLMRKTHGSVAYRKAHKGLV